MTKALDEFLNTLHLEQENEKEKTALLKYADYGDDIRSRIETLSLLSESLNRLICIGVKYRLGNESDLPKKMALINQLIIEEKEKLQLCKGKSQQSLAHTKKTRKKQIDLSKTKRKNKK